LNYKGDTQTMMPFTHLDGSDVVVTDARGRRVPAVEAVRVEPGIAVVSVTAGARAWVQELLAYAPDEPLAGVIHSLADGQLRHQGALRVVCV